jgi:hypothetical protein
MDQSKPREATTERLQILKAAGLYFGLVFGVGFMLGTLRVLWLVPTMGTRTAELLETPLMFVVIVLSARWVTRHVSLPPTISSRLIMGGLALALAVALDFTC